jgi:agmatine deiminase
MDREHQTGREQAMKSRKLWGIVVASLAAVGLVVAIWFTRSADGTDSIADARLAADFEPVGALVLACQELAAQAPQSLADVVVALDGHVPLILLVNGPKDQAEAETALAGLSLAQGQVEFLKAPHDSCRIGHYGPAWLTRGDLGPALLETARHATDPPGHQRAVTALASRFSLPLIRADICVGGGNLLTNGNGLALTTTTALDQNADLGLDAHMMDNLLRRAGGITQTVFLEPLKGEPTGHVRMFAAFTSPDTVVVGRYPAQWDPENAAILDRNAESLQEVEVEPGKPLNVRRIPMPPHQPGVWLTYTTAVFANGRLLVPSYPGLDAGQEEQALEVYTRLLPDWEIIPIDARPLLVQSGALRSLVLPLGKMKR